MDAFRELLACPACAGALSADWSCRGCGARFEAPDGIPNLRLPRRRAHRGGPPLLRSARRFPAIRRATACRRCRRGPSGARSRACSTQAIPGDARIVEIGCGTGQMCLYLARADRVVIGADLTRASLLLGAAAARRFGLEPRAVRRDRSAAARLEGRRRSTSSIRRASCTTRRTRAPRSRGWRTLARPGGTIVLGVYNAFARAAAAAPAPRRAAVGIPLIPFDPVLRDRGTSRRDGRRGCAISISIPKSTATRSPRCRAGLRRMASSTCGRIRARCSATSRRSCSRRAADNWRLEGWLAQLGWIRALGHEGGLFFTIGRRLDS